MAGLKVMAVHGVGHEEAHPDDWQPQWTAVIIDRLTAEGRQTPTILFPAYDEVFETRFALLGPALAPAIGSLLAATGTALWFSGLSAEEVKWSAGMVAVWLLDPTARFEARNRVRFALLEQQPDLIICHSLGSDLVYDLMTREPDLFAGKMLLTAGSQINNALARTVFVDGVHPVPQLKFWYHIYNPNDHVFTAQIGGTDFNAAGNFSQATATFSTYYNTSLEAHAMTPAEGADPEASYLTNVITRVSAWVYFALQNPKIPPWPPTPPSPPPKESSMPAAFPNIYRTILKFADGAYGFTETHFDGAASSLTEAVSRGENLARARKSMMSATCSFLEVFCSLEAYWRDSLVSDAPDLPGTPTGIRPDGAMPWEAFRVRAYSGDPADPMTYHKNIYFRGIPKAALDTARKDPHPSILAGLTATQNVLKQGYGWVAVDHDEAAGIVPIVDWVGDGLACTITTPFPHGYGPGQLVKVYSARSLPGPSPGPNDPSSNEGVYEINATPTTETLVVFSAIPSPTTVLNPGYLRLRRKRFVPYFSFAWTGTSRRKTGNGPVRHKGRTKKAPRPF